MKMKKNLSSNESIKVNEKINDLRIYATNSEILDEETALKNECNWREDFGWGKFKLPDEFLDYKFLHLLYDSDTIVNDKLLSRYTVIFAKNGNNKFVGRESFDLNDYWLLMWRTGIYDHIVYWAESHNLDLKIIKLRRAAYKSPSKYFSKKEHYVRAVLQNKRKVQLTDNERRIVNQLFYTKNFDTNWFFEDSALNKELKLSGKAFDAIIESLMEKKILEKSEYAEYELYVTV
jgi:hypothetical protein